MIEDRSMRPSVLADFVESLSPQAALWRALYPDVVWDLHATLAAMLVNEVRMMRYEARRMLGGSKERAPELVTFPGSGGGGGAVERSVVGAGAGFDTIEAFDAWYTEVKARRSA